MHWSDSEDLLCVQADGRINVFSLCGIEKRELETSLGKEVREMSALEVRSFNSHSGTGLACLSSSFRFFLINNYKDAKLWRPKELPGRVERPSCWTVISSNSQRITKVLAIFGNEIFLLTNAVTPEQILPSVETPVKKYVCVAASPDGDKIALLSQNGLVQILSADLKYPISQTDSGYRAAEEARFFWAGPEAVSVYGVDFGLCIIGSEGGSSKFVFDMPVHLSSDPDGLKIISPQKIEFISRVHKSIAAVYQVASSEPGALLFEAFLKFNERSHQAYDFLRMIEGAKLQEAVDQCISAAGHEFDQESQAQLLEAASFGHIFLEINPADSDYDRDQLISQARILRVLNALRDRRYGIPLSYDQLTILSINSLIDRLIARAQWPLAIQICEYLKLERNLGTNRVLGHWALKKIEEQANKRIASDNRRLAALIKEKFDQFPGVSYADVAEKAAEFQLTELASMLLDNETDLKRQVTMLLKLNQIHKALSRATESGDRNLIYTVILELRDSKDFQNNKSELDLLLRRYHLAYELYKKFLGKRSREHLRALYKQEDDFLAQAKFYLEDASTANVFDTKEKIGNLQRAKACFSSGKEELLASQVNDQIRLLSHQSDFEAVFGQPFFDLSLRDTVIWLIENGENNRAELLRKEFKIADKQFWWWKIEALCRAEKWTELENWSKAKKSPIGYLPFIEVATKYDKPEEASKYLAKLPAGDDLIEGHILMKNLEQAGRVAYQSQNVEALGRVLSHCGPKYRGLSEQLVRWRQELETRGKK